jgi:hypothetical protein
MNRVKVHHWKNTNVFVLEVFGTDQQLLHRGFCSRKEFEALAQQGRILVGGERHLVLETYQYVRYQQAA